MLNWVLKTFPNLNLERKWNQPTFTNDGTFIIVFSVSKHHISVAPEKYTMHQFRNKTEKTEYSHAKMLFRISFNDEVNYLLLKEIIACIMADKKGYTTFWRKYA